MRKYAWLLTLGLLALGAAAFLTACGGEAVPPTPRSTITPTSIPPSVTTTSTTPTQTGGIPLIPHSIAGRENCLVCHETGIAGSVAVPADHAGRTNDTCTACHQTAAGVPTGTTTTTATQPNGIVQVPHDITGRQDCLSCHQTGIGGAATVPADHAGRTNDICTACHQVAATPTVTIAQIVHAITGRENCLLCHQNGVGGAAAVPADHAGITNDKCQTCHFPAANPVPLTFPQVPHSITGLSNCLSCHQTGVAGAPVVPGDHAGRTNDMCTACHTQSPTATVLAVLQIPHLTAGLTDCLSCHQTGVAGAPAVPSDHAGRTNSTCTTCHTQSPSATALAIPQIPHLTAGYESCSVCHATGIGGAPAYPADHAGRPDSTCTTCHVPAANQVALRYPNIPHSITTDQCLICHQTGLAGAPAVPADHANRTNDTCQVCHKAGPDSD